MALCSDCLEVEKVLDIDIQRLLKALGKQKGRELSDKEQRYLCLSLLGTEPMDIARLDYYDMCSYGVRTDNPALTPAELEIAVQEELKKKASQDIRPFLSKTINSFVKNLMDVTEMPSWSKVMYFLKQNGYTMIDLSGESKKRIKIRVGHKPSDKSIVEILRRLNNPNISVVFQEIKQVGEQND